MAERSLLYRLVGVTPGGAKYETLARARTAAGAATVGRDFWFEQGIATTEIEVCYLQEPTQDGHVDGPLADHGVVYEPATAGRFFFFTKKGKPRQRPSYLKKPIRKGEK